MTSYLSIDADISPWNGLPYIRISEIPAGKLFVSSKLAQFSSKLKSSEIPFRQVNPSVYQTWVKEFLLRINFSRRGRTLATVWI
jgi:hypothetical protein